MKVLITGCNGFIGNSIYQAIKNTYKVIGIDINSKGDHSSIHHIDITNYGEIENFLKDNSDISIIIHAAALAHNKGTDLSFDRFNKVNFEGTKNLLDACNRYLKLKRFIFFSTISVYGEKLNKNIYYEDDKLYPKTPYALTKKMSEDYIRENAGCNFTILRFVPVYGNAFYLNIDRRSMIMNHLYTVGRGDKKLSLLNILNIIELIKFFLDKGKSGIDEIYNVADSAAYTYQDIISFQLKKTGAKRVVTIPRIFIYCIYLTGRLIKNNFLTENSIKLLSDNVYNTDKLSSLIELKYTIGNSVE